MGRVGSDFLSAIAGRVNVSPGRVGSGPRKVTRGQLWAIATTQLDVVILCMLDYTYTWHICTPQPYFMFTRRQANGLESGCDQLSVDILLAVTRHRTYLCKPVETALW